MKETTIDQTLVLCDLDSLLLDAAGNLPQLQRDVLQLFASRGGRLTVFSQRSPRAVRSLLGGVRLSAPALVCGGTLAYNFSEGPGTALCSFEGMEESVLKMLPSLSGVGIALQMRDGSTRAVRMSEGLVFHLKQEWTPFVLSNAADVKGEDVLRILFYQDKKQMPILPTLQKALGDAAAFLHAERLAPDTLVLTPGLVSGSAMLNAVCPPSGYAAEQLTVLAGCTQMLDHGNEAVIINGAEITGMQPSIDNLLLGNVRIVVVSGAYGRALYAQLPFFVDPHGHALQRQADGADLVAFGRIDARGGARFGHAVAFQ